MAKPFLKSPGGKRQLLKSICPRVPEAFNTYHEPFIGGGALFFRLHELGRIKHATISDVNQRIISTYRAVRDDVEGLIMRVQRLPTDRESFYSIRANPPVDASDIDTGAWHLYMNKCAFNGLYRENKRGVCNTPYGTPKSEIIDPKALREASVALQCADIRHCDFEDIDARAGDFVYLDPPYWPVTKTANFVAYTAAGFSESDQMRVRDVALRLRARGVHVLVSNSSTVAVRQLYSEFHQAVVEARRAINCRGNRRGMVDELLMW